MWMWLNVCREKLYSVVMGSILSYYKIDQGPMMKTKLWDSGLA